MDLYKLTQARFQAKYNSKAKHEETHVAEKILTAPFWKAVYGILFMLVYVLFILWFTDQLNNQYHAYPFGG